MSTTEEEMDRWFVSHTEFVDSFNKNVNPLFQAYEEGAVLVVSRGEGDYKVGDNVNVYILGEPEDTTYASLEEIPSLEDQVRGLELEASWLESAEMLEGYEMAKADVLALIELWNEEW